jgi:signal transduction histidine kinase
MDLPARRNLLLAVKEAVRNAVRHSGGSELSIQIKVEQQQLEVVVTDNGKGLSPEAAHAGRNGLGNMVERLADVGGACRLTSAPGAGCRVSFVLPLVSPQPSSGWHPAGKKRKS